MVFSLKEKLQKDIELQSEDILFLPTNEKNKIYVVGAVNNPNVHHLP